jgi:hypothetical protein
MQAQVEPQTSPVLVQRAFDFVRINMRGRFDGISTVSKPHF